jgi:hypothetical protein
VRRTRSRPRPRLRSHRSRRRLRLPVRVGMQRHHAEVWLMWERRCRIRMHAVAGTAVAAVAGTAADDKLVLTRPVGLCLRLSFRAGLCLRLCLSLSLGLDLISPHLGLLLLPVLLHEWVIDAGTAVRTKWGHRRLRVQRGSLRLYLGARLTLCLGRPGMLLKVVKMVEWWDPHLCHCRAP